MLSEYVKHGNTFKYKIERGGSTVKHILPTRCWRKMFARLAGALQKITAR